MVDDSDSFVVRCRSDGCVTLAVCGGPFHLHTILMKMVIPFPTKESDTNCEMELEELGRLLTERAEHVERDGTWPTSSLEICRNYGVFKWFIPEEFGGWGWSERQILAGYLCLSESCLTTAFVVTQWQAAARRILVTRNLDLRNRIAKQLVDGSCFVTVGISQLTTSRQHTTPPLRAQRVKGGYVLNGYAPWVTGANHADLLVLGAVLEQGQQILAAVPARFHGVTSSPGMPLLALTASCTDQVKLNNVFVDEDWILSGPAGSVISLPPDQNTKTVPGAGGLQTSILALGHARRAAAYLRVEAQKRESLIAVADKVNADIEELVGLAERLTDGEPCISQIELRSRANSLVLRVNQAALQAAKGAGFIQGHQSGRWAKEALFFLVWSCPQEVVEANLCELAGLST